jgi:hypothetical protein
VPVRPSLVIVVEGRQASVRRHPGQRTPASAARAPPFRDTHGSTGRPPHPACW